MISVYTIWVDVLFDMSATHSFFSASYAYALRLKIEKVENPLYIKSPMDMNSRVDNVMIQPLKA